MIGLDQQTNFETHKMHLIILEIEQVKIFRRTTTFILS